MPKADERSETWRLHISAATPHVDGAAPQSLYGAPRTSGAALVWVRVRSGLRGSGFSTVLRLSLDQVTQGRRAARGGTGPERVMGPRQVRAGLVVTQLVRAA